MLNDLVTASATDTSNRNGMVDQKKRDFETQSVLNGKVNDKEILEQLNWRYSGVTMWIAGMIRFILITLNNFWAVATYIVWCYMLLPLRYIAPELYQRLEQVPFSWLQTLVAHWLHTAGYEIYESGDDVRKLLAQRQCLVVFNHQSTADVPVIMSLLADVRKHPAGQRVCWVMDQMFRYTHFGIVSSFHGDFFIQQGRDTRQTQLVELKRHLETVYLTRDRTSILLFPEGGFLYKRRETSQAYARKYGYPVLEHVTLPRIGALETILNTLAQPSETQSTDTDKSTERQSTLAQPDTASKKHLEYLIDVTIAYPPRNPLDIAMIFTGYRPPCSTIVHYRAYHINDIPQGSEALLNWLYERWAEKDAMLEEFYKTGNFPSSKYCGNALTLEGVSENGQMRMADKGSDDLHRLPFDLAGCLTYNAIFLLSTYFHWRLIAYLWSAFSSLVM